MDLLRILRWWLLFLSYGIVALPACWLLFRRFADKGYSFARIIGYVGTAYLMFVTARLHVLKFSYLSVILCAVILICVEIAIFARRKDLAEEMTAWFRSRDFRRHAICEELIFFALLAFWAYLRAHNPDLNSLEKYMNLGFLNSMLNSDFMPPQDMWFAGSSINYYYFGHFCAAVAAKLSGLTADVAYNLMMATLMPATFCAIFSLVYSMLSHRKSGSRTFSVIGGLTSSVMVCLAGNLHHFVYGVVGKILYKLNIIDTEYSYWFADATRYIGYQPPVENDLTITEFPLYSYIVSDLHAHVMNVLPVLLFLATAYCFVLSSREKESVTEPTLLQMLIPSPHLVLMGALIGTFSMTNFWDYPIYMVVSLFIFAYTGWRRYGFKYRLWFSTVYQMVLLFVLNTVVSLPFTVGFESMFSGIGIVKQRSLFYQLLVLWGGPLLIGLIFALWLFLVNKGKQELKSTKKMAKSSASDTTNRFTLKAFEVQDIFVLILFICGFGLAFGTEFVYVRDIYEENYPRANTMFKLSYQAFILFNTAMGYAFVRIVEACKKRNRAILSFVGMSAVMLAMLGYITDAVPAWYGKLSENRYESLDGIEFIKEFSSLEGENGTGYPDYDAVKWIQENTPKDSVILETYGDSYTDACFVSMSTGRATVVGWQTHEWLWHNDYGIVAARQEEVDAVYKYSDSARVREIIAKYGIDYIYIGHCEYEKYGSQITLDKLLSLGSVCFKSGDVTVIQLTK
ncbi:MAG: hypothetical protein IKT60_05105 [Clostridia bacterium]|nr:hypothetical protein [Clostridia bacterium]